MNLIHMRVQNLTNFMLTYKLSGNAFSGHLLTAKEIEACICRVLVCDDTQQPDTLK